MKEGKAESLRAVATKMLEEGIAPETISKITGLTKQEILAL